MRISGFFIISGFLVTKSFYSTNSIKNFFQKRIKRIFPAYIFVIFFCAFGFSFLSENTFSEYFSSPNFWKYLAANLTFLNFLQPELPGIFTNNHYNLVNASLWTLKIEIIFYLLIPVIALLIKNKKIIWIYSIIYIFSFVFSLLMIWLYEENGNKIFLTLNRQFLGQYRFFISGAFLLFYFDKLMKNMKFFAPISIIIFFVRQFFQNPIIDFLYPISFAVIIIFLAYNFKFLNNFGKFGDFSYGMYLFHFPVIQVIISLGIHKQNPIFALLSAIFIVGILSFASWHLLEKKFLKRK
jgi:peptidoglycan/LPS O-acetylase OafA/YrhL